MVSNNIPIRSIGSANPYPKPSNPHLDQVSSPPSTLGGALNSLGRRLESATRKAGSFAENLYTHLRTGGPDGTLSRLAHGTRVLAEGGCDRLFRQLFPDVEAAPGEKLVSAYACYLSTTAGPVMGTLYISNRRVAFCSDQPLRLPPHTMELGMPWNGNGNVNGNCGSDHYSYYYATGVSWCYYKVVVMLHDLVAINASSNLRNPSDKYIQLVTKDARDFWFIAFIFYDKALKDLRNAIHHHS